LSGFEAATVENIAAVINRTAADPIAGIVRFAHYR